METPELVDVAGLMVSQKTKEKVDQIITLYDADALSYTGAQHTIGDALLPHCSNNVTVAMRAADALLMPRPTTR